MANKSSKQDKKIHLLETELGIIKGSRSYKLVKALAIAKNKVREDPVKVITKVVTNPQRVMKLIKGNSTHSAIDDAISNRVANYHTWIALNEPDSDELEEQRKNSLNFKKKPVVSIITPVFNPPVDVLEELIKTVLNQTYPYFELCLGDFGTDIAVKELMSDYAKRDSRVKFFEFKDNKGIADNSNAILEKATGEYIALLDHDDTLSPNALFENILKLNDHDYDFIFSDKDMIDDKGNRYEPQLKPDLSYETMLNANYLTHFDVMKKSVVDAVGGWDSATDGAQDWDLFLKIMTVTDKITHIPKILYHWRVIETSTAHSIETKPYALAGQRNAVQKYLNTIGALAKPYHIKTEMLLKWDDTAVDKRPDVVVISNTVTSTLTTLERLRADKELDATNIFVVCRGYKPDQRTEKLFKKNGAKSLIDAEVGKLGKSLNKIISRQLVGKTLLFVSDHVHIPKKFSYPDMAGWLSINGVSMVGAKIMNDDNQIVDCGAIVHKEGISPIFYKCPPYRQSYIGNVEWVRNLHVLSTQLFIADSSEVNKVGFDESLPDEVVIQAMMMKVSRKSRLVMFPKATVYTKKDPNGGTDFTALAEVSKSILDDEPNSGTDRYSNANLNMLDPMRLSGESPAVESGSHGDETIIDKYVYDAMILSQTFDLDKEQILDCQNASVAAIRSPKSVGWVIPSFDGVYAGLNNIFSFADYLATKKGLKTYIYILKGTNDVEIEKKLILERYPNLKHVHFQAIRPGEHSKITNLDIGICTLWSTAFVLAKSKNVKRKCYFIQDNEVNFYPTGSISALVDLTYKLNFYAIANTPGLLEMYSNKYGGKGTVLTSKVDLTVYKPATNKSKKAKALPYRVFFYGRPNMPRNAFELGIAGLRKLKEQLGDKVEIVTAGADWDPSDYNVGDIIQNLGKMTYEELPEFYRNLDAGLMFMFSGHPGVIASELMASGCPVVVNQYDDITWNELYQDEVTCLVSLPTASEIARNIRRALEDQVLRSKVIAGGSKKAHSFYKGYDDSLGKAYKAIIDSVK